MISHVLWRIQLIAVLVVIALTLGSFGSVRAEPGDTSPDEWLAAKRDATPTNVKTVIDDGLVYIADGRKHSLLRRTDEIVVAFRPVPGKDAGRSTDAGVARLTAANGPLRDFVHGRTLAPGLRVLRNPDAANATDPPGLQRGSARMQAAVASAEKSGDVAWAASVYVNGETGTTQVAANEVIVAFNAGENVIAFFAGNARFTGYRPLLGTNNQFIATVAAGGGDAAISLANELNDDRRLAWASPNFYQELEKHDPPNDPIYPQQWHLENIGQNNGRADADVDAQEAWTVTPGGSSDIVVAILDDGIEYDHPDLAPNLYTNVGEIPDNNLDDDGNGWIDDINGWDFTANDNFPGASSTTDAHSTSVAGVVAAAGNNGVGVTGIAYKSRFLPVRIFGDTGKATSDANIASAVYYAAGRTADGLGTWRAADILNNSWGGGAASSVLTNAFTWASTNGRAGKGAVSYIATGNGSLSTIAYPANLAGTINGVVAVGASTNLETRATYSNYGQQIDFVAPSSGATSGGTFGIVTTDRVGSNGYANGDYTIGGQFGGTSSATPLAAGIGALVLSLDPELTAAQVRGLMRNTSDLIGPMPYANGFNHQFGYGRVNAATAVRGVGVAELQVVDGAADVIAGGTVGSFKVLVSQSQTRTFVVRNQGTVDLNLGSITIGPGPFSLAAGFSDTTLSVGEATTFSVAFTPTNGGPASGVASFSTNDADESTFTFNLSGTGLVTSIAGYAFEDWDGDGVRDGDESVQSGWEVYLDQNNNGVLDANTFTTNPETPIPDNTAAGITSVQMVSGLSGPATDVNVRLSITHKFVADLQVSLISPSGTRIPLINRRGGAGDNYTDTELDDEASASISTIAASGAPFTGRFRPESPLAAVDGEQPNGTWQLHVADRGSTDTGMLVSWSLIISTEQSTITDSTGFYAFLSLAPGTYNVRSIVHPGWNVTAPANGSYSATIINADTQLLDRNFGYVRQNAIYGQQFNDLDGDAIRDEDELGNSGWQVFVDSNANGLYDVDDVITTNPETPIPDNMAAGITSTLLVSELSGPVTDVNVRLSITHKFVADLQVSLISPSGTRIPLINRRGGAGDNYTDTELDDEASASISTIAASGAPFTGRFRPESPLAAVDGEQPNGTWQLHVADRAQRDAGMLVSWSLIFENEATTVTGDSGKYVFTNRLPGVHPIRQVNQAGWRPTLPQNGVYNVSLADGETSTGNDFGNMRDTTLPTADIVAVTPDPRTTGVNSVMINFDEAVTGFDLGDLSLLRDGSPVSLAGTTLTGSGSSYSLEGIADVTSAIGVYTLRLTASGSDIVDLAQNALTTDASSSWTTYASTRILYTGRQVVNIGESFVPSAQLRSSVAACAAERQVRFALDANPTTGAAEPYAIGQAATDSAGIVSLPSISTIGWPEGLYNLTVSYEGTPTCVGSYDKVTFTVGVAGGAAMGGGGYTLSEESHVNFGFTVWRMPNTANSYRGQLLLINKNKWRLKGRLNTYARTSTGYGAASGTGALYWWDESLNNEQGGWQLVQDNVSYTASFYNSDEIGQQSTDSFGIRIVYTPTSSDLGALPNSAPVILSKGDIRVE